MNSLISGGTLMKSALKTWWRSCFVSAVVSLLLLPAPGHAAEKRADPVKTLVSSILVSYGGKDAVTKVRSVVAKGTIADFMKNKEGEYARYFARPQKLRIDISLQGGESRVLDGMRGWLGNRSAFREVRPILLESMIYQYSYLDLPMGLADNSSLVTYGGKQTLKGRPVELMNIEVKGAPKLKVYVDSVTRLIIRVASDFNMGMGPSELATEYEDFRTIGNVRFPFRLVNYSGDMKLSVISLSDIQVNSDIPPEIFTPVQNPGERRSTL